jgi:hypothetical protein
MDGSTYIRTHIGRLASTQERTDWPMKSHRPAAPLAGKDGVGGNDWRRLGDVILDLVDALRAGKVKLD